MNKLTAIAKLKVTGLHVAISLVILLGFLYFMLTQWYRTPYFFADQGWSGVRIMIFVDLFIGPVITAIVYLPTKTRKALVFDFTTIAIIQLIALAWGGWLVYNERALAYVYYDSAFRPVITKQFNKQNISLGSLKALSPEKPPLIYRLPVKSREDGKIQIDLIRKGIMPANQYRFFRPLKEHLDKIFSFTLDIKTIANRNIVLRVELDKYLQETGNDLEKLYFLPLSGRDKWIILIFNKQGDKVGHLYSPFKLTYKTNKETVE
jgi:hypothetical protein